MTSENSKPAKQDSLQRTILTEQYDPFLRGRHPVGVRTILAPDSARDRIFPCEIWYPASSKHIAQDTTLESQDTFLIPFEETPRRQMAVRDAEGESGNYPLIVFSHGGGRAARRMCTFLCTHLSSHGYVVAALDHSEITAKELARKDSETEEEKKARAEAWITSRVPDVQFLLDYLLNGTAWDSDAKLDPNLVGIVGHSFGGWTALSATAVELRIRTVVALAPGGSSKPKPGILPATIDFSWGRDVPALYLVAENDIMTPITGMHELFENTRATKQMFILERSDHLHFIDNVEQEHETARTMSWPGKLAWIPKEMQPITELCSGEEAHLFVRGLTVCHMDAILKKHEKAQRFLRGNLVTELAIRGVRIATHNPGSKGKRFLEKT